MLESPCRVAVTVAESVPLFVIVTTSRVAVCETTICPKSKELLFTFSDAPPVVNPQPETNKPSGSDSAAEKKTRVLIITVLLKDAAPVVAQRANPFMF